MKKLFVFSKTFLARSFWISPVSVDFKGGMELKFTNIVIVTHYTFKIKH
jgi:hypothetical protein